MNGSGWRWWSELLSVRWHNCDEAYFRYGRLSDASLIAMLSWPPLVAVSLIFESNHVAVLTQSSWQALGGVIYTALGASLIGHAGMFYLLQRYECRLPHP